MSDRLISYLSSTLADSADGAVTFQWMSDEETAAIETDEPSEFTVQPWIDAQTDLDRGVFRRFGERSLFLRGLLEARVDEQTSEPTLGITEELQLVVDARRLGVAYVLARAAHHGVRTARNYVLQSRIGAFEEEIDGEGIHLFSACTYRAAVDRLAEWTLPGVEHGGAAMRTRISADRWQAWVLNELGVDVRIVEINLFLPGENGTFEPDTWLLAHGHGVAVLAAPEGDSLGITSLSRSRLAERLGQRIADTLRVQL